MNLPKLSHLFFMIFFIIGTLYTQTPNTISWQGLLLDANGSPLNGQYNLTIKLYDIATGGEELWTEVHNNIQITNGLVNLELGSITALNLSFDKQYWLEFIVGQGTPLSRIKLTAVPYSLYSKKSSGVIENDSLVLKDANGVTRMILNPNTGTFKMMNNDTVWYELKIQSPLEVQIKHSDGTYAVYRDDKQYFYSLNGGCIKEQGIKEEIKNGLSVLTEYTKNFSETGFLYSYEYKEKTQNPITGEIKTIEEKISYSSEGKIINKDVKIENGTQSILTKENIRYDNNNNEIARRQLTFENDKLKNQKDYEQGKLVEEIDFYTEYTIHRKYNENGQVIAKETTEFSPTGEQIKFGTDVNNTSSLFFNENTVSFQAGGNTSTFKIEKGPNNSYNLGVSSNASGNPSIQFYPNNFDGQITYSGYAVFNDGIYTADDIYANGGIFFGDLNVMGTKNFRIDYPDDPENKYLLHASIESDEVLNQYSGNVITDENGIAIVNLPSYVEKINTDFRYQLTVIGEFAQAIILKEIQNNQFVIKTDKPNVKVSWQITAKRNDKYIQEHPFVPIIEK